jgi:hypothetical protein
MGLTGTFLLGTAVNLIGLPSQTSGGAHIASLAFLAAHMLIALGLVLGAVMVPRAIPDSRRMWRKQAILGVAAISMTTTAGVLTLLTKSNWWSYAMAAVFITALLTYGSILAQPEPSDRRPADPPSARGEHAPQRQAYTCALRPATCNWAGSDHPNLRQRARPRAAGTPRQNGGSCVSAGHARLRDSGRHCLPLQKARQSALTR